MNMSRTRKMRNALVMLLTMALAFPSSLILPIKAAKADPGDTVMTLAQPPEIPIEIEVETGPGSLKQAALWKELVQLLDDPYEPVERRPGFGVTMPELEVWPLDYNFLTGQTMRLRTSDGEVSLDQPGVLFDPDEVVAVDEYNVPTELRTVIGELIVDASDNLVVSNPDSHPALPPDGTIVAVPAMNDEGMLHELVFDASGVWTGEYEEIVEFETPLNENDFIREATDTADVPVALQPFTGRAASEVLGKALFWDMQVGSDGVQACASCHFHAGVDNRTKNQLNPNTEGGDFSLEVAGPNGEVVAGDFPFHKLVDPTIPGEPLLNPGNVAGDKNDTMSSMGVVFREFIDIPEPGPGAFGPLNGGVRPLLPDIGSPVPDPIPVFQGLRRVEPRNTPTFHGAAFNFDNFWDGRARFHFNGGSVQGQADPQYHVFVDDATGLAEATNGYFKEEMAEEDPEAAEQPPRIKFSSLASQAVGPPLSNFEMSFDGRNWPKIGKKLLQNGVTPLANQLVDPNDSVLGPFSRQRSFIGGPVTGSSIGRPGLLVSYNDLVKAAFNSDLWSNTDEHLAGMDVPFDEMPPVGDPFDGYKLSLAAGPADPANTDQFTQMEANFSLFFGLSVQTYEELTIPDDTPFDKFMDANPNAAYGVGQPGEQNVLFPTLVPELVGELTLIPDDPSTPWYDGFQADEVYGFDIFAGANLTAALSPEQAVDPISGINRNPDGFGSNPFSRTARCMQCHLGPEQTDHSINIAHGTIKGDAEYEFPTPPEVPDNHVPPFFPSGTLPAPESPGPVKTVGGLVLAEEVEETAQDAVEVEPRNFTSVDILVDDPSTPWIDESTFDDRIVAQPQFFAFGDQGIYNVGLRPIAEDKSRGNNDAFGWPLSMSALCLKNIGGEDFEPPDGPLDPPAVMTNFDPDVYGGGLFEEAGEGAVFPGTTHTIQSINPGLGRDPIEPMLPEYMATWTNGLPAGELHPQIDEQAGMAPNTITAPNGGPAIEFAENIFGSDPHCGEYNPALYGAGPPNYGWGPRCPNNQSGVPGNLDYPIHGTWPMSNRVLRDGAFKAPSLRNSELTGPYFHTGSYLTLRDVVDFYIRGGDFPVTNGESRDPHMMDIVNQCFGFGTSKTVANGGPIPDVPFADALPDTEFQYDPMPDTDHPITPEPPTATVESAKTAIVRYLIALTDSRVKCSRAPFDYPELFVPIDGTAPDNTGGRTQLLADNRFMHLEAVGADGLDECLDNFLGVLSEPDPNAVDHFDVQTVVSTFSMTVDRTGEGSVLINEVAQTLPWMSDVQIGEQFELEAIPAEGWLFDHWEGDLTGSVNPETVTVAGDTNVTAVFVIEEPVNINITKIGRGWVNLNGTPTGLLPNTLVPSGDNTVLHAVPVSGWTFDHWEGDLTGSQNPVVIAPTSDQNITAVFVADASITLNITKVGRGWVNLNGTPIGLLPDTDVPSGSVNVLHAVPVAGWSFDHWEGDVTGSDNPVIIVPTTNQNITAVFVAEDSVLINITKIGRGWVNLNGTPTGLLVNPSVPSGSNAVLHAVPVGGWVFDHWEGDLTGNANPAIITPSTNQNITAVFVLAPPDLAVASQPTNTPTNTPTAVAVVDAPTPGPEEVE